MFLKQGNPITNYRKLCETKTESTGNQILKLRFWRPMKRTFPVKRDQNQSISRKCSDGKNCVDHWKAEDLLV